MRAVTKAQHILRAVIARLGNRIDRIFEDVVRKISVLFHLFEHIKIFAALGGNVAVKHEVELLPVGSAGRAGRKQKNPYEHDRNGQRDYFYPVVRY